MLVANRNGLRLELFPLLSLALAGERWRWPLAVKGQHVLAQRAWSALEVFRRELAKQFGVSFVGKRVFAVCGSLTRIQVDVLEIQLTAGYFGERGAVSGRRVFEA